MRGWSDIDGRMFRTILAVLVVVLAVYFVGFYLTLLADRLISLF